MGYSPILRLAKPLLVKKIEKLKGKDWLVIISSLGCLGWIATIFFGGMILFLLMYFFIIIPIVIAYFVAVFKVIGTKGKIRAYWIIFLSLPWIALGGVEVYYSELIQGEIVLSGTYYGDSFHYTLNFREQGKCDMYIVGMLGYTERIYGKYSYSDDRIFFLKKPYSNDTFLSDSLFVDRENEQIHICNTSGNPCTKEVGQREKFIIDKIKLQNQ
ncbi:MAG: hypothetical protein AAFY45_34565 [Bacteroidota bacterium]